MTTACYPLGEKYCGIEVMRSHVKGGMCEECRSRPYKGDAVLDELIAHFGGFENQKEFRYSASDIIQYLTNFKKLVELRQQEREP
jgi:hypothetical protein